MKIEPKAPLIRSLSIIPGVTWSGALLLCYYYWEIGIIVVSICSVITVVSVVSNHCKANSISFKVCIVLAIALVSLAFCGSANAISDVEFLNFIRKNSIGANGTSDPWTKPPSKPRKSDIEYSWNYAYGDKGSAINIGAAWVVKINRGVTKHIRDGEKPNQTRMFAYMVWQMKNELMNRSKTRENPDTWMWFKTFIERLKPFGFDISTHLVTPINPEFGESDTMFDECVQRQGSNIGIKGGALNTNLLLELAPLGSVRVAKYLVEEVGLDPNFHNCTNQTAAYISTLYGHWEYAKYLLSHPRGNLRKTINLINNPNDPPGGCNTIEGCFGHEGQMTIYDLWKMRRNFIFWDDPLGHVGSQWRMRKWVLKNGGRSGAELYWRKVCELRDPYKTHGIEEITSKPDWSFKEVNIAFSKMGNLDFLYRSGRMDACQKYLKQVLWRCHRKDLQLDCDLIPEIIKNSGKPNLPWGKAIKMAMSGHTYRTHPLYKDFQSLIFTAIR